MALFSVILIISLCWTCGSGSTDYLTYDAAGIASMQVEDDLFKQLFVSNEYRKNVRPADQDTGTTWVALDIAFFQLIDLNEKEQTLMVNMWKRLYWRDYRLRWDNSNDTRFANVKFLMTRSSEIWMPDIVLYSDIRMMFRNEDRYYAKISRDGSLFISIPTVYRSPCRLNMANFPFDEHNCQFTFGSWAYDAGKMNLTNTSSTADLSFYDSNNEFWLVGAPLKRNVMLYACCPNPYVDITYSIIFRRKPLFYQFNLVLPCLALVIVILISFRLPPESGERISLGVTVLLALSVFLQLVGEHTPTQSESIPLICVYFAAVIGLSSLATLGSVIILILHFNGKRGDPMPKWLRILILKWIATIVFLRGWASQHLYDEDEFEDVEDFSPKLGKASKQLDDERPASSLSRSTNQVHPLAQSRMGPPSARNRKAVDIGDDDDENRMVKQAYNTLMSINETVKNMKTYTREIQEQGAIDNEWEASGFVLDRLLFWIFLLGTLLVTIIVLWVMPPYQGASSPDLL